MKIGLRIGHSPNCTGASGIVIEYEQMEKYFEVVKNVFEKYNHTVIDCNSNGGTPSEELSEGANKCNSANCDLFISLHMNCFNGSAHGTEVLVSSESSSAYPYAQRLVNNFAELGFTNRGVKFERLYEMNHVNCGNIISEICFCDSQEDINIYNQYSWDKLAHVLCNAIDSNIPKDVNDTITTPTSEEKVYIVSDYLPKDKDGYLDTNYVLEYFKGVKCYFKSDSKGIWIVTDWISKSKADELKASLGSWYYDTRK